MDFVAEKISVDLTKVVTDTPALFRVADADCSLVLNPKAGLDNTGEIIATVPGREKPVKISGYLGDKSAKFVAGIVSELAVMDSQADAVSEVFKC